MCFFLSGEWNLPEKAIHTREKTVPAKACSRHRCEVNILGKLVLNFDKFVEVSRGEFCSKIPSKCERSDRFQL